MPIVLVHGNPETDAIWDEMRKHLVRKDVVTLSPPGFGAPLPEDFGATSDDYVAWLKAELAPLAGPIDLVGHDWGGGHVFRLVMEEPDLVRSWAMDIAGCFDPSYTWHDFAQVWQTPGAGEEAIKQMLSTPVEARAQQYASLGMTADVARRVAEAANEDMGRAILALYRSAAQPKMAEWGGDAARAAARPGLVIVPTEDHFTGGPEAAKRTAARAGAQVAVLDGLGHWWMCQDPQAGAAALNAFYAAL